MSSSKRDTQSQCQADAIYLTTKYRLPCPDVLVRAMFEHYLSPTDYPAIPGKRFFDFDKEESERFRVLYGTIHECARELGRITEGEFYRGVVFAVNANDEQYRHKISEALWVVSSRTPLDQPQSLDEAYLPRSMADLGDYLLFVTGRGPEYFSRDGRPTFQRRFVADALALMGWGYPATLLDGHCWAQQEERLVATVGQCKLRLVRDDKLQAKAWQLGLREGKKLRARAAG